MKFNWQKLPRPFFVQAPMENVTDTVFRRIIAECGRPDVFFTEFTSTDGMLSKGKDRVGFRLQYTEIERPLIAQIWGSNPEHFYEAAQIVKSKKFDGIDINMGCPVSKIISKGSCSGLIRNPNFAKEIYDATVTGSGGLPVSIKTRIGYGKIAIDEWIGFILGLKPAALTVHLRTVSEMSKVPAHFEVLDQIVQIKNQISPQTVLIANGDIMSRQQGIDLFNQNHIDGVMIGRGIFHNLWVFNSDLQFNQISQQQRLSMLIKHIELFDTVWGKNKHFDVMRKFYKVYVSGLHDASSFRMHLMTLHNAQETIEAVRERMNRL